MEQQASLTSLMSAFCRAYHNDHAVPPLFADTKAKELLTPEEYRRIADYIVSGVGFFAPEKQGTFAGEEDTLRYLVNTQLAPIPLVRARFCEDSLHTAVRTGTVQYVILGAGLDTFAFREPAFAATYEIYEVDHPLTQADKRERIRRAGWEIPAKLHFVPVDFTRDDVAAALTQSGFDPRKKTFFSWLGVSMYLDREEIDRLLRRLALLSADGSDLVFDYAGAEWFRTKVPRVQHMVAMAKAGGEPMKGCFDRLGLEQMLADNGFLLYEHLTDADIQHRYFDGRGDGLSAFEHMHLAHAVFKN